MLGASLALAACAKRETLVERGNREQTLERAAHVDVADLDPHTAVNITEIDIASALFEGLVGEDPVDLHPVPGVADRWDRAADGLTYTFFLRPEARWSNGDAITANDFIESWRRMLTPALGAENASLLYVLQGAEAFHRGANPDFTQVGAKAIDPHTLRVTLEHPTPYLLALLSHPAWFPVPLKVIRAAGNEFERGNRWTRPATHVGNGPFVLKTWRPGQEILVEKSPTYWDAKTVRLHAIRFHPIDSVDAEERAFRTGQLHVTYMLAPGKVDAYRRENRPTLRSDPYIDTYFLRLNTTKPPFDKERVRRALSLAIDRSALVDRALRGGQKPANSLTPPGLPAYTPPAEVRTDLAEARRLLAEAGHPNGEGLPAIELLFNTSEYLKLVAEALQEMWRRDLGVKVQLVNQEFKVVLSQRRAGQFQMVLGDWVGDYLDASTFLELWRSDSSNNFTGWRNAEYDGLLFAAARNADVAARAEQMQRAESILLQAAPVIPLYYNTHTYLLHPAVRGWHPTLLDHHPYKHVWLEP